MKIQIFFLLVFLLGSTGTVSAQNKAAKSEKMQQSVEGYDQILALVESNQFRVNINRVYSRDGTNTEPFNLQGVILMNGSITQGELPFFGQAYSYSMGEGSVIAFEGPVNKRKISQRERRGKKTIRYQFSVQQNNERFQVNMTISPDGNCFVNINSNRRQGISYSGSIHSTGDNE